MVEAMIAEDQSIGKRVKMMYGTGGLRGTGEIVGYHTQPTFIIRLDNGVVEHWAASLTEADETYFPNGKEESK